MRKTPEDIHLFIDYQVRDEERAAAKMLVSRYAADPLAVRLLAEYYTNLPEVSDEGLQRLSLLMERRGVWLLVLSTTSQHYLAMASDEEAQLLGYYPCDEIAEDILTHFNCASQAAFRARCLPVEQLAEYQGGAMVARAVCPVCGVSEGEVHFLGCPVELCPWCDGQLNSCNCRFDHLQADELSDEAQLEALQELLDSKGRIPFAREHKLAYPGTSAGLDTSKNS